MPVSTPSYFPPSRTNGSIIGITAGVDAVSARSFLAGANAGNHATVDDLIIIGDNAAVGPLLNVASRGTIVIGSGAYASIDDHSSFVALGASTILGYQAGKSLVSGAGNIFIGDRAAAGVIGTAGVQSDHNVIIGTQAAQTAASSDPTNRLLRNVIIGAFAAQGSDGLLELNSCVVIGFEAIQTSDTHLSNSVLIGSGCGSAGINRGSTDNVVMIGANMTGQSPLEGVWIGSGTFATGNNQVVIGQNIALPGTSYNVVLGDSAAGLIGSHNVVIGSFAGVNDPDSDGTLIIEIGEEGNTNPNQRLIYGKFGALQAGGSISPGLIFGNSKSGVNDSFPANASNIIKFVDGAVGTAAPVGGGYLVSLGGVLNIVDTAGKQTSFANAGFLMTSTATLLDGAGLLAGTLLNAPVAGNPSKWLEIMDNGVLRRIPTW